MTTAAPRSALATFWGEYAFTIAEVDFLRIDVALGAMAHGEWAAFERRLTEGLACAARAAADHVTPDEDALDDAATSFRYERDLISGADMNAWLEQTGLSMADWMAYLTRDVLRRKWAADMDATLDLRRVSCGASRAAGRTRPVAGGARLPRHVCSLPGSRSAVPPRRRSQRI